MRFLGRATAGGARGDRVESLPGHPDAQERNTMTAAATAAAIPPDEQERLQALRDYQVLDTDAEDDYDDLAMLASQICGTPIALVSLVDRDRQWFKARVGLERRQTPRDVSFCAHAILRDGTFVVPDTSADPRFANNPLVVGDESVRFYAGQPLVTPEGYAVGTLCVMDKSPRAMTPAQQEGLAALGRQVVKLLEMRRHICELNLAEEEARAARAAAESATRIKTRFVSSMSHELRTPVNAVIRYSRILLEDPRFSTDYDAAEELQKIYGAGRQILGLLDEMTGG
jgi:GAF domain-containing protein